METPKTMDKEIIKKGFAEAEKQQQEQEVQKVKEIVQKHLEKIAYHQEHAKDHAEKAKLLRKDLDDLKAGRLDRIEERQEKDAKAKEVRIIEVHRIVEKYIPLQPWYSPFNVVLVRPSGFGSITTAIGTGYTVATSAIATNAVYLGGATTTGTIASNLNTLTGATCSAFASGTYIVAGNPLNL